MESSIYIWDSDKKEIHEEAAAIRLSQMNKIKFAHYTDVSEGKTLLIPDIDGLFGVDTDLQNQINQIEDISISTLPNHYHVNNRDKLASIRTIILITKEENILKAESLCKNKLLYNVYPFEQKKVQIIITSSEIYTSRIMLL